MVAMVLLAALTPVFVIVAAMVRLDDGGPSFVRVVRVGRGGRPIRMWKFRSMRGGQASALAGGPPLTARDDERITRVGRWIRHFRIDELPQLVNVARGEMALIGPRPEAPEFVDLGDRSWQRILAARPGIAGPTQALVHRWESEVLSSTTSEATYRSTVLPVKKQIDEWYVEHASPSVDLLVLATLLKAGERTGTDALRTRLAADGLEIQPGE